MPRRNDYPAHAEPRDPDQPCWDPAVQMMPREQLRALQDERLTEMIGRVLGRPVPFFARKLEEAGIDAPEDVRSVDDLSPIPVSVKQEFRDSETSVPPLGDYRFFGTDEALRVGMSSGTTGAPTTMLWTARDLWVENETAARFFWGNGVRPGMVVTQAHPGYLYPGGLQICTWYEYFGCLCIWVPPPDTDELAEQGIRMWQRIRPEVPFNHFSVNRFKEVAAKLGLDPERDLGLSSGATIKADMKRFPLVTAGLECFCIFGNTCSEDDGAHLAEDYTYVQAVDPDTGLDVPDGEWGNLVVTTFGRDSCMLRYDLEEACRIDRSPCPCGQTTARAWWGGRASELLATQGKRIWVLDVEALLSQIPEVATPSVEFVAVKPTSNDAPLKLRVEVDAARDRDEAARKVTASMRQTLGIEVAIEVLDRGALPRAGYKVGRVSAK